MKTETKASILGGVAGLTVSLLTILIPAPYGALAGFVSTSLVGVGVFAYVEGKIF